MTRAYDPASAGYASTTAPRGGPPTYSCTRGSYMWFNGPSFETPAEIRAAKILGADLVGMSTAPGVILARYHGLHCVAVSLVTNFAAGLSGGDPSHEETAEDAAKGAVSFQKLLRAFIARQSIRGVVRLPQEIIRAKRDGRSAVARVRSRRLHRGSLRPARSPRARPRPLRWRCSFAAWTLDERVALTRAMKNSGDQPRLELLETARPRRLTSIRRAASAIT